MCEEGPHALHRCRKPSPTSHRYLYTMTNINRILLVTAVVYESGDAVLCVVVCDHGPVRTVECDGAAMRDDPLRSGMAEWHPDAHHGLGIVDGYLAENCVALLMTQG